MPPGLQSLQGKGTRFQVRGRGGRGGVVLVGHVLPGERERGERGDVVLVGHMRVNAGLEHWYVCWFERALLPLLV